MLMSPVSGGPALGERLPDLKSLKFRMAQIKRARRRIARVGMRLAKLFGFRPGLEHLAALPDSVR